MSQLLLLQGATILISLVAIASGLRSVAQGIGLAGLNPDEAVVADNDVRYLGAIWAGVGAAFLSTVPTLETSGAVYNRIGAVIIAGGVVRLISIGRYGGLQQHIPFALFLELIGMPLLLWWYASVLG